MTTAEMIRQFMEACNQYIGTSPHWPDDATLQLRTELIREEYDELWKAVHARDLVETADALVDIVYVTIGMAIALGIDFDKCFDAIHSTNMRKRLPDGKVHFDERMKVIKPPGWEKHDLREVLGL